MHTHRISSEAWRLLEPFMGSDIPNEEVVRLSDVKALLASGPTDDYLFDALEELRDVASTLAPTCLADARAKVLRIRRANWALATVSAP